MLGAIASATERIRLGTGVTCPTIRIHPAIIAQAAATTAALMPGRFFLGVGTGENLNEHILGQGWPDGTSAPRCWRRRSRSSALLWAGEEASHHGRYYTVENARLYTLPHELPPIYVAGSGARMAATGGPIGDGFIGTGPEATSRRYAEAGGRAALSARSRCAGLEAEARRTAREWWPTAAIHGEATQELPSPAHFEELAEERDRGMVAEEIPCGPDPGPILGGDPRLPRCRLRPRLPAPGRARPGGFLEFARRKMLSECVLGEG